MITCKFHINFSAFFNSVINFHSSRIVSHKFFYNGLKAIQGDTSKAAVPGCRISDLQFISKLSLIPQSQLVPLQKTSSASKPTQKKFKPTNYSLLICGYKKNLRVSVYSGYQNFSFSFWVKQLAVLLLLIYCSFDNTIFAACEFKDCLINEEEPEKVQNNKTRLFHKSTEVNEYLSIASHNTGTKIEDAPSSSEALTTSNKGSTLSDDSINEAGHSVGQQNLTSGESEDQPHDELNVFAPVFVDELQISDPVELSDAQSLTHCHLVMQSAAVAAESSLLLVLRVSRALLATMKAYRGELQEVLQLLQYQATLLRSSGSAAQHLLILQQVTDALVAARTREHNWAERYKDCCVLMRVAHQSSDSTQLCAHIAGADLDAQAIAAAAAALRPKIEELQREIRILQREVRVQQAEVISSEQQTREETDVPTAGPVQR